MTVIWSPTTARASLKRSTADHAPPQPPSKPQFDENNVQFGRQSAWLFGVGAGLIIGLLPVDKQLIGLRIV